MNNYVFLDTNIYDEASFSFGNPRMTALSQLIKDNDLSLLMCSVCKGEVKKHIKKEMSECVQGFNKQLKERYWAALRYDKKYEDKLKKLVPTEVISDTEALFEDFLASNNVVEFPINGIDIDGLISDHFNQVLPFETAKPDEFKDAIMIRALIIYQQTLGQSIDIVSKDEGFRKSFDGVSGFEIYCSLDEWIEKRQSEIAAIQTLDDCFDDLVHDYDIQEEVAEKIGDIECSFDERTYYSFYSSTVQNVELEFCYAYFKSANEILVMVTAVSDIEVCGRYLDEANSFYSSEEKDYVFKRYIDSTELHRVRNDILLQFSLVPHDEEQDEEEESKDLFEFQEIVSVDCDYIELSEDTLLKIVEEEENGDDLDNLVHCSQCGKVLGLNDSGCYHTSDGDPLCEDCCETDEEGFICPMCGLKHPYEDDSGDGICKDCFMEYD